MLQVLATPSHAGGQLWHHSHTKSNGASLSGRRRCSPYPHLQDMCVCVCDSRDSFWVQPEQCHSGTKDVPGSSRQGVRGAACAAAPQLLPQNEMQNVKLAAAGHTQGSPSHALMLGLSDKQTPKPAYLPLW
jgi:hypothetical protein